MQVDYISVTTLQTELDALQGLWSYLYVVMRGAVSINSQGILGHFNDYSSYDVRVSPRAIGHAWDAEVAMDVSDMMSLDIDHIRRNCWNECRT